MYTRVFLLDNLDNSIPKDGVDHEVNVNAGMIGQYFTNMVAIIFLPSGRPHLANHPRPPPPPPPPVRICPFLPDPLPPLPQRYQIY